MDVEKISEKIFEMMDNEEYEKALELLDRLPSDKYEPIHLDAKAFVLLSLERFDEASDIYKTMLELGFDNPRVNYFYGYTLYCMGDEKNALHYLNACLDFGESEYTEDCRNIADWIENGEDMGGELDTDDDLDPEIEAALREAVESGELENCEYYSEREMETLENHIAENFGDFDKVLHELFSPDIHVDIAVITPNDKHNYYILSTMGMGAHSMNIPEELEEDGLDRAELVIYLPPDWKIDSQENEWYWPVQLLKMLARLPIENDSWLGWGHSVDFKDPFAENTELCSCALMYPEGVPDSADVCVLPNGSKVNFYQVLPLYIEEMQYKIKNGMQGLLKQISSQSYVVDPHRDNVCINEGDREFQKMIFEDGNSHADKVREKELPLDEITGFNHMAIYLRWCIEHDMMDEEFAEDFAEMIDSVKNGGDVDLRVVLRDELDGLLAYPYFNEEGFYFSHYYYGRYTDYDEGPFFPSDIDDHAEKYFGTERYNSEEFKDEAYLFVPYDERYYLEMKEYLDSRYADFVKLRAE